MKQNEWKQVYEPVPQALDRRLAYTFSLLREEPERRRLPLRTAVAVLALLVALAGIGYAVFSSQIVEIFGRFYGQERKESLLAGDIAIPEKSITLGDVTYTLDEVIFQDGTLYGMVTMKPGEGADVVLMASDHYIWEPAGYVLHIGDEEQVPEEAPTYLELAETADAKIIMPICNVEGYINEKGELSSSEVGMIILPNTGGTVRMTFEFAGYGGEVMRSDTYTIRLRVANWEVDRAGNHLREDANNTYIGTDWEVTVTPELRGE